MIVRFIPARAGNSWCSTGTKAAMPVHPRACGEQGFGTADRRHRPGSSPRVRGTASASVPSTSDNRFIPARAGNSDGQRGRDHQHTVHPRACGEQMQNVAGRRPGRGSSPRVRGTVTPGRRPALRDRFIPARAGNRPASAIGISPGSVHPRACGEQIVQRSLFEASPGSSPRVRGTVALDGLIELVRRFIPARAGNSKMDWIASEAVSVHPRACGEQPSRSPAAFATAGSSPRVRGTGHRQGDRFLGQRFIPARAGNSSRLRRAARGKTVHPRACGEQACRNLLK